MSKREYFKELVKNDKSLNEMQVMVRTAEIDRAFDELESKENLREKIKESRKSPRFLLGEIYKMDDRYVIYEDKSDNEIIFKTYDMISDRSLTRGSYSHHEQVLVTLGEDHDGTNSQFWKYGSRMLGIE